MRGLSDPGVTGDRAKQQRCEAIGHWLQISTWVAGERTDGFLTGDIVDLFGRAESTRRLLRARYDREPLMHQRDPDGRAPDCKCLEGRVWPAEFEYALHDYLDRNPSRAENDVHKAKRLELRDSTLKHTVRTRDRDICRYCGRLCKHSDRTSDAGLTYDHVDPLRAAGAENLVVACRGCNRRKGARTPEQADMRLLTLSSPSTDFDAVPATVTGPVATPDSGPDLGRDPTPDPTQPADQDLSPSPDLRQDSALSQPSASPGRDGDGDGVALALNHINPEQGFSADVQGIGPPDTRRGPGSQSPYGRLGHPHPDHYAGVPATDNSPPEPAPRQRGPGGPIAPTVDPEPRPTSSW